MYHYFYDSFLGEKKFHSELTKTETRLMDLGINGKVSRISFLKNVDTVIKEEMESGAKTFVIVGNDITFGNMLNHLANLDLIIGFIPIGEKNNSIAGLLGIPVGECACDILSARIITSLDLGKINNSYFLTSLELPGDGTGLDCEGNYYLSFTGKNNSLRIYNLAAVEDVPSKTNQGLFTIEIKNIEKKFIIGEKINISYLKSARINISHEKTPIAIKITEQNKIVNTPASVELVPQKLKVIVGKKRLI